MVVHGNVSFAGFSKVDRLASWYTSIKLRGVKCTGVIRLPGIQTPMARGRSTKSSWIRISRLSIKNFLSLSNMESGFQCCMVLERGMKLTDYRGTRAQRLQGHTELKDFRGTSLTRSSNPPIGPY